MAAVRPEFRADVLAFDPGDPVFGGDACRVPGCGRTARAIGMCYGHHQRWVHAGRPDPGAFAASGEASGPWFGHAPLTGCTVPGCGFGAARRRLCPRHMNRWLRAGKPGIAGWIADQPTVVPGAGQAPCRIGYCQLWAHPGAALCYSHHRQWKDHGCPDLGAFISDRDQPAGEREQADLTALPDRLRLEVQYALQCRRDDNMIKTKPATVRSMVRWLAAGQPRSSTAASGTGGLHARPGPPGAGTRSHC